MDSFASKIDIARQDVDHNSLRVGASPLNPTSFLKRDTCPICGSMQFTTLYSRPFLHPDVWGFLHRYYGGRVSQIAVAGGNYEIASCSECGGMFQVEILEDRLMGELYSNWISSSESLAKKERSGTRSFARYAAEVEVIPRLVDQQPADIRVLDFGMGWGHWCAMAQAFGMNATGIELSKERILYAQQLGLKAVPSLDNLRDVEFDFVNIDQVLEHLPAPQRIVEDLVSILRPGGVIRLSVPDGRKARRNVCRSDWKPSKDAIHPLEHINCFTNRTLKTLAFGVGLEWIRQPLVAYSTRSHLGHLKNVLLRTYRSSRTTTLYFRRSI
jgi:2-polyprenyl-3-methyl-5-hydroxy-6-metoxy-1,4-benzoquinol methylase